MCFKAPTSLVGIATLAFSTRLVDCFKTTSKVRVHFCPKLLSIKNWLKFHLLVLADLGFLMDYDAVVRSILISAFI